MRNLLPILLTAILPMSANALQISSAKIDDKGENIIIEGRRGGGCAKLTYTLEVGGCLESLPVQCTAKLVASGLDMCEAIVSDTAVINIKEAGLKDKYFSNASLTIVGDRDSKATIQLPDLDSSSQTRPLGGQIVSCTTHTGSKLTIQGKAASLITTDGNSAEYKIVKTDVMILESMPPQEQKTLSLDDGRKIVTIFMDGRKTGRAYFVRLDGSASPSFNCSKFGLE